MNKLHLRFVRFGACISLVLWVSSAIGQEGNCMPLDLEYICQNTEFIQTVASDCGLACLSEGEVCLEACMEEQLGNGLTNPCIGCFGDQVSCIVQNCYFICAFGTEEACAECALTSCEAGFNSCAGIVDEDADTWTNLCDCNDSNPSIFPGAEGTGQGVDNNCNGLLSSAELANCIADINEDNIVGTADLLIFLGTFDCDDDCYLPADLNDDGYVGASDLLILLSEFGLYCL